MQSKIDASALSTTGPVSTWNELRAALMVKPLPVPEAALDCLVEAALGDTGQSQVCRWFLFWIAGLDDPTGFKGEGALELRRLDSGLKEKALEILAWWTGPTQSDTPLYSRLERLEQRFRDG